MIVRASVEAVSEERQYMKHLLHAFVLSLFVLSVTACAQESRGSDEASVATESLAEVGVPLQYRPFPFSQPVPTSEMTALPTTDPAALGGVVIAGNPQIYARIDDASPDGRRSAGVFEVTGPSVLDVFYPFDEHSQFTHGACTIRGEDGVTRFYGPGDAYFIRAGSVVRVTVLTPRLQKSFYNVVP